MNNGAVTIQYDADGNRVAKTVSGVTTRYLVDDLNPTGYAQVVEEVTGTTASRTYTYGFQRISQNQQIANAWTPSFYGYDGGGTVRLLTDSAGTVTDTYDYDAWGNTVNTTGSTPNVYLYRSEQFDSDLLLHYLRARYFNPLTGRFLTRDPWAGVVTNPVTLHRYLFASGDPVGHSDPSGRATMPMPMPQTSPRIGGSEYVMLALAFALNPAVHQAMYNVGQTIKCWWVDIADELRGAANAALLAVGGGGGAPDGGSGLLPYRPSKCRFTGEGINPGTGGEGPKGKICIYYCAQFQFACYTDRCKPCPEVEGGGYAVPRDEATHMCH
jgi:RHS repeat-associated protein